MGDFNDPFMRNPTAGVQARAKVQNRANVMQLKMIGQSHPTGLTANLLKLFEPRPPLDFKPPPEKRKCPPYTGMAQFTSLFAKPDDPDYAPPVQKAETSAQRKARIHKIKLEEGAKKAAEELEKYDPNSDHNISGDPYKTLFVARLNYETSESRIKREFEAYGPIKRVRLVTEKNTNKPRGYAFIEYVHTRDMKSAYKQADGKKIDNRRVLVDVERGRTVPNWRPRRLGGGLGTTRVGGEEDSLKNSEREKSHVRGVSHSVEPRSRDDRNRDREKSRDRVREKERDREKSRERSPDRERDHDRHRRDREKTRDREREKDRGRDRTRDRERDHDHRDKHRDRHRDRDRVRDDVVDHERGRSRDRNHERGRSRDKDYDYEKVDVTHGRDRHGDKEKKYDVDMDEEDNHGHGWGEQYNDGSKLLEAGEEKMVHDRHYDDYYQDDDALGDDHHHRRRYKDSSRHNDQYDPMEEEGYDHEEASESKDKRDNLRSRSREYDY